MARLSQWSPYDRYVQSGLVDGQFMNASFTLLAAGPPRLANIGALTFAGSGAAEGAGDDIVFPIGIVQNFNLSHNRQFNRIWEIGSERSFFISGRTVGQLGLARVLYHGPSLLRVLYAYYQDLFPPTLVPSVIGANNIGALTVANAHNVKIPPGFENMYLNLASDLFNQPIGLMAYFRDSNEDTVGSIYMESCYIPNHTVATDAQGTIIQENTALQFERALPVAVSALALVGLDAADQEILGI
jgi:hypothetical protein